MAGKRGHNIIPMPTFTDPKLPEAAGGSINFGVAGDFPPFEDHPVEHSDDYGVGLDLTKGSQKESSSTKSDTGGDGEAPADRADWTNAHYKEALAAVGLSTSGNRNDLSTRLEEYETVEAEYKAMNATEWKDEIDGAENAEDLETLRAAYERSGADFSTVTEALDAKAAELNNQ